MEEHEIKAKYSIAVEWWKQSSEDDQREKDPVLDKRTFEGRMKAKDQFSLSSVSVSGMGTSSGAT